MNEVTSLIAEATNVNTSPERLRELLNHADDESANLGLYLVSNPNTTLDVLLI